MRVLSLGLLGRPVAHSVSPAIHRAALASAELTGSYELYDVAPEALPEWVARLRAGAVDGLNVTIPYKVAVAGLVDRLEGAAAVLGAVNTLVPDGAGGVVGHNTDVSGLLRALREALGEARTGRGAVITVNGAGGAGRGAALAAVELGAVEVRIANRTLGKAVDLAATLAGRGVAVIARGDLAGAARGADLLIQATSLGMGVERGTEAWRSAMIEVGPVVDALAPGAVVMDLVYRPEETVWCEAARAAGHTAVSGLPMLVHQAADAFALWTGVDPPREALFAAARAALT